MLVEPLLALAPCGGGQLVGAGGVGHIMIVDVVDNREIVLRGESNRKGHGVTLFMNRAKIF